MSDLRNVKKSAPARAGAAPCRVVVGAQKSVKLQLFRNFAPQISENISEPQNQPPKIMKSRMYKTIQFKNTTTLSERNSINWSLLWRGLLLIPLVPPGDSSQLTSPSSRSETANERFLRTTCGAGYQNCAKVFAVGSARANVSCRKQVRD